MLGALIAEAWLTGVALVRRVGTTAEPTGRLLRLAGGMALIGAGVVSLFGTPLLNPAALANLAHNTRYRAERKRLEALQIPVYAVNPVDLEAIGETILIRSNRFTVIGLLGYTTTEVNRRRKELAIRRISGARLSHILRIFIRDLELLAIPSVMAGLVAAWFTIEKWMQNFAVKIGFPWPVFVLCSAFILLLVAIVAAVNYTRSANRNPIEALRYE